MLAMSSLTSVPSTTMRFRRRRLKISIRLSGPLASKARMDGTTRSDMSAEATAGGSVLRFSRGGELTRSACSRVRCAWERPVKRTATRSLSSIDGAQGQQAGEAGRAGRADREAGRAARRGRGPRAISASVTTTGRAAAGGHALHDADPVVGLVVEDAVGERPGLVLPRPHALGPRAWAPAASPIRWASTQARASGAQPSACTAWSLGWMPASAAASPMQVASAPPPTWTNVRSRKWPRASITSQPIVRPVSRLSAFSGPCTTNGTAPSSTAARKRCTHGSPGGSSTAPGADARRSRPARPRRAERPRGRPTSARTPAAASRRPWPAWPPPARRCRTRRWPAAGALRHGATPSRSAASRCRRMPTR